MRGAAVNVTTLALWSERAAFIKRPRASIGSTQAMLQSAARRLGGPLDITHEQGLGGCAARRKRAAQGAIVHLEEGPKYEVEKH